LKTVVKVAEELKLINFMLLKRLRWSSSKPLVTDFSISAGRLLKFHSTFLEIILAQWPNMLIGIEPELLSFQ